MFVTMCTMLMRDSNFRIVVNRPSIRPHSVTDINVFAIETKCLVEQPDRTQRGHAEHDAGSQHPINGLSMGVIAISHQVTSASVGIGQ
jgi:hypothetical protein